LSYGARMEKAFAIAIFIIGIMGIDNHPIKINNLANGVDFFQPIQKVNTRGNLHVIKCIVSFEPCMLPSNPFIMSMMGVEEMNDKDIAIYIIISIRIASVSRDGMTVLYIMKMGIMHTILLLLLEVYAKSRRVLSIGQCQYSITDNGCDSITYFHSVK
jgi:hypothetical protein